MSLQHDLHSLGCNSPILARRLRWGHGRRPDDSHFIDGSLGIPLHRGQVNGDFTANRILSTIRATLIGEGHGAGILTTHRLMGSFMGTDLSVSRFQLSQLLEFFFGEPLLGIRGLRASL